MTDRPAPTTLALIAVLQDSDARQELQADFARWLQWSSVDEDDTNLLVQQGSDRLLLYRALVHGRIGSTLKSHLPRTIARLGRRHFHADMTAFMEMQGPRSPYLRELPREFVEWAKGRWSRDTEVPDYLADLAEHECMGLEVANTPAGGEPYTGSPLALDRPLRIDGSVRLVRYSYAVHRLSSDPRDRTPPTVTPVTLLVYRDRQDLRVRYLGVGILADAVLELIISRRLAVLPALAQACAALGERVDQTRISKIAGLLTALAERGIVLGAESEDS